jgi:hypothetical protein
MAPILPIVPLCPDLRFEWLKRLCLFPGLRANRLAILPILVTFYFEPSGWRILTAPRFTRFETLLGHPAAYWLAFSAVLTIGIYLRFQQITIQWLMDDEWHAVHKLVATHGFFPILLSFGQADYSIPLTILYKFLAQTVGLNEMSMRLPMLLGGTAFVVLAMLWIRKRMGKATSLVFGVLLAVSPLLVNYSRNARPYMLTLLLVSLSVWALACWERGGWHRYAATYLFCTWLASWAHPIMAPFTLALLLPLYIRRLRHEKTNIIGWREIALITTLAAAGIAALILPPLLNDPAALAQKTGSDLPNPDTLIGVWHIWLGTGSLVVVALGLTLASFGLKSVCLSFPRELAMWSSGLFALLFSILVLQPAWVHNPLTFGRYLLPMLPLLLLLISAGVVVFSCKFFSSSARPLVAIVLSSLFLIGTPHADLLRRPNNFTLHSYYQFDYRKHHNPVRQGFTPYATASPFWHKLATLPPESLTVAVAGSPSFESYFLLDPLYQPVHRQILIKLQTGGTCGPAQPGEAFPWQGVFLRNAVSLAAPEDIVRRGIDLIVLEYWHTDLKSQRLPPEYVAMIDQCKALLNARFGSPIYEDANLIAFRTQGVPLLR